jgi:hypothetical protein
MIPPSEIAVARAEVQDGDKQIIRKQMSKIGSRYNYSTSQLQREKLVKEEEHHFHLTSLGELVAKLVNVRTKVKAEKEKC